MSVISDDLDEVLDYLNRELKDEFSEVLNQDPSYQKRKVQIKEISSLLDKHFEGKFALKVSN